MQSAITSQPRLLFIQSCFGVIFYTWLSSKLQILHRGVIVICRRAIFNFKYQLYLVGTNDCSQPHNTTAVQHFILVWWYSVYLTYQDVEHVHTRQRSVLHSVFQNIW